MTTPDWDAAIAERVGQTIKSLRTAEEPKLSAAGLAERCARFGYPMTKAQISDLELKRKKTITVAELIVLAAALGRPPVELLYPDLPHGPVDVWPGTAVPSVTALQWFSGETTSAVIAPDSPLTAESTNARVQAARGHERLREASTAAARRAVDEQLSEEAVDALRASRQWLAAEIEDFRAMGWPVNDLDNT